MKKIRRVEFFEYVKNERGTFVKGPMQEGIFHQFGCNFEEFESGPGNYTTAIIELDDGTVKSVPVQNIKFLSDGIPWKDQPTK